MAGFLFAVGLYGCDAGGGREPCPEGMWLGEAELGTVCEPWTTCEPGEYTSEVGTSLEDRRCAACSPGEYSASTNAVACLVWQVCPTGLIEGTPGTTTADRSCVSSDWTRQFGSTGSDGAWAVGVHVDGSVVVAGYTTGSIEGAGAGGFDGFVRKYGATGALLWTRQLGTAGDEAATAISVDSVGAVVVAGYTTGAVEGASAGGLDAYVRKYDADGALLWTRQFGTVAAELAYSVAIDGQDNIIVTGYTEGGLEGASLGGRDAYVRKYDSAGAVLWTRQFGTALMDTAHSVAVDDEGAVIVVGDTFGQLDGTASGNQDAYVRKYDATGVVLWTRQFGTMGVDAANGVGVDGAGDVIVAGETSGALEGAGVGRSDAYVRKYGTAGDVLWTRQFGTTDDDYGSACAVDAAGNVVVVGDTFGALERPNIGIDATDVYVRMYDSSGDLLWTRQGGGQADEDATSVRAVGRNVYVVEAQPASSEAPAPVAMMPTSG
ncbi:MAG: hypothetical protein IPL19_32425 [Sandaracinaceae bacterium]|nr:hypothetical protein [Sandaracinaceae bacterium]